MSVKNLVDFENAWGCPAISSDSCDFWKCIRLSDKIVLVLRIDSELALEFLQRLIKRHKDPMKGKPSVPDFFPVCDCGRNSLSQTGSYTPNCYLSVACGLFAVNYASASAAFPLPPLPFAHGFCKHNYRQRRAWAIHRQSKMRFEPALRRTLSNNAPGGRERNMRLGCA